jgi:hypothetical protein
MRTPTDIDASKLGATKARRRRPALVTPAIVAGGPFKLTADEHRIAEQFFKVTRTMEEHAKTELHKVMVRMAESMAEAYPRHRPPALRLMLGGAA